MTTPAWYKGITPNFTANKYMWVNDFDENSNGTVVLYYSERVSQDEKYTDFEENRETTIAGLTSVRLCTADEIAEIHRLKGTPVVNNHYSII